MKPIWWFIIGLFSSLFLIGLNIGVILIAGTSWVWILISLIAVFLGWVTTGVTILIIKIKKKPILFEKLTLKSAKDRAIYDVVTDENNPDNLIIEHALKINAGSEGKQKTAIAWIQGTGSENGRKINLLYNLNDQKADPIRKDNVSNEEMLEIIRTFAENPSEKVIEETIMGRDQFGNPMQTTKVTKTSAEKTKEKEEKEAIAKASAL